MAREEVGRFTSIYQFCEKVDLGAINRRMIESLIRAGAMDSLEGTRVAVVRRRGFRHRSAASAPGGTALSGQGGLFGGGDAAEST